jgi:hypothetical protein
VKRASTTIVPALFVAGLMLIPACRQAGPVGRAGIAVSPPRSWTPAERSRWNVPGVTLSAWAGPEGSSLVLFQALPIPDGSAVTIADALAYRLENLPELQLKVRRVEMIGETSAARLEVIAPGTGDALAPSALGTPKALDGKSLVPTRQVTLGIPRPAATLYLLWHVPESAYGKIAPDIEATLGSIRLASTGKRPAYGY